jgi:hypothetical protein
MAVGSISSFRGESLAVALAFFLSGAPASASILSYGVANVQQFGEDVGNAQPTVPYLYLGFADVDASIASDFTEGTVTSLSPLSPMTLGGTFDAFSYPGIPLGSYKIALFDAGSDAQLDTDFPNNATYVFNLAGSTFGGQSATLTTPASDAYPTTIPFFTNFNLLGNSIRAPLARLISRLTPSLRQRGQPMLRLPSRSPGSTWTLPIRSAGPTRYRRLQFPRARSSPGRFTL